MAPPGPTLGRMRIDLSDSAAAWVRQQVASGRFASEAELIQAALEVLAAWEAGEIEKLASLRREIARGLSEDAEEFAELDIAEIEAEGRRLLEEDRKRA